MKKIILVKMDYGGYMYEYPGFPFAIEVIKDKGKWKVWLEAEDDDYVEIGIFNKKEKAMIYMKKFIEKYPKMTYVIYEKFRKKEYELKTIKQMDI